MSRVHPMLKRQKMGGESEPHFDKAANRSGAQVPYQPSSKLLQTWKSYFYHWHFVISRTKKKSKMFYDISGITYTGITYVVCNTWLYLFSQ